MNASNQKLAVIEHIKDSFSDCTESAISGEIWLDLKSDGTIEVQHGDGFLDGVNFINNFGYPALRVLQFAKDCTLSDCLTALDSVSDRDWNEFLTGDSEDARA